MVFAESLTLIFAQQAEAPPRMDMPLGPMLGVATGVVLLGLLLWGLRNPQIWVIVAVLSIGIGFGGFVYGIALYNTPMEPRMVRHVEHAALAVGGGAGGAVGGFLLLIVAVLRMRMATTQPAGSDPNQK